MILPGGGETARRGSVDVQTKTSLAHIKQKTPTNNNSKQKISKKMVAGVMRQRTTKASLHLSQTENLQLKMKLSVSFLVAVVGSAIAYSPSSVNRRDVFQSIVASGAAVAIAGNPSIANALEACPKGSKNCIRTEWTPPVGTKKDEIVSTLKKALDSYPQEGQSEVDKGGWAIVEDFSGGSGRVEFKSGLGNFAKFFNGGKPFVDDMKIEVTDSGVVSVRSSSRIGDSDLGVNQKRLQFFVTKLRESGWNCPDPIY